MTFEASVIAFAERFLTNRTFELIVAPALADLQFDDARANGSGRLRRARNYIAVLRAVGGGVFDELSRDTASFLMLTLLPMSYYVALITIFWDFFMKNGTMAAPAAMVAIVVLSLGPVMACFWPERHRARSTD
jgi:hypothetical protein